MKELLKKSYYILIVVAILLLLGCKEDDDANALPVIANFTFTVDGDTVTFLNASEQATAFLWDFGDGSTSTETNPIKTYTCLLYTSPSPRDRQKSRMPSSA